MMYAVRCRKCDHTLFFTRLPPLATTVAECRECAYKRERQAGLQHVAQALAVAEPLQRETCYACSRVTAIHCMRCDRAACQAHRAYQAPGQYMCYECC